MINQARLTPAARPRFAYIRRHYLLYLMLLPPVVYYVVFHYMPMYGLQIAFKNYSVFRGIAASPWAGFNVFKEVFAQNEFMRVVRNTLVLNLLCLVLGFPAPIMLALLLNELRAGCFKKIVNTLLYLPYFMSWVIVGGMMYQVFSSTTGVVNNVVKAFGLAPIPFLTNKNWWVFIYFIVSVWHDLGWGAIIYLAAITAVDSEIYEAACVDGCSRLRMVWSITLPNIMSTIMVMLILRIGSMANIGFEQPLMLGNAVVREVSDVISTYVYRIGLSNGRFNIATAVGLAQSLLNFLLVIGANQASKRLTDESIL